MRRLLITMIWLAVAFTSLSAQAPVQPAASPSTLRLSVDDAVKMALDNNPDLAAARLGPQIGEKEETAATGAFRPVFTTSFQQNNQLQPPSSFLVPVPTRNDATTTDIGVTQVLPRFGTSYKVGWNAVRTDSNSFLNSFNPLTQSGLSISVSQPLLRNLGIDTARRQLAISQIDRRAAGTELRDATVRTTWSVKTVYWNLVTARANVEARKFVLDSAMELVRVNQAKVKVGQTPPLDLVAAQAEVASDQEQLIIAQTTVKEVEDQLRVLIFDTSDRSVWNTQIDPADAPPLTERLPDLEAAITNALRDRSDLELARRNMDRAQVDMKFTGNQRLPDVRLDASYLASGLGGTEIIRTPDFPGTIVGTGSVTGFGSVLNQLLTGQYPTWSVGLTVNYPLGRTTGEANYARAKLEHAQLQQRLKSAESRAVQQVRDAWWKIEMNAKRIETTRAARELAAQRLDAERKRFDVGMSTSFLVIQAQRDLAQARTNELAATLGYDLSLVDFEALQQAGPVSQTEAATSASAPSTMSDTTQR